MVFTSRFECHQEPNGSWAVWDKVLGRTASLGGCILTGRTQGRAEIACAILERIYQNRLDARSMRRSAQVIAGDTATS